MLEFEGKIGCFNVAMFEAVSISSNKEINHCTFNNGKIKDNHLRDHLISCTEGKFPCKAFGKEGMLNQTSEAIP